MAYDEILLERVRDAVAGEDGVSEIRMFGGVCIAIHGNMAIGVNKDDLVVRVGPDAYDAALADTHARPMDFTGRPLRGMVYVARDGFKDKQSLNKWVGRGVRLASRLPKKQKKG